MPEHLCISIRFLDGAFHGRADQSEPEWPPSPLRLYQALVAAAAARWNERGAIRYAAPALRWFETLPPPSIVAPASVRQAATGYRLYVPDNIGDLVGSAWSRGREASIADYRTEKLVRPVTFEPAAAVRYLWPLTETTDIANHRETLFTAVRSITHLGWGIDLVIAEASILPEADVSALPGQRWFPSDTGRRALRMPCAGTFEDLERRHRAFLNRINGDAFSPVSPLAVFSVVSYGSDAEPPARARAVFALRQLDDSGYRSFDSVRRGLHVAGMMRYAASRPEFARSMGWSDEGVRRLVLGHAEPKGATQHQPVTAARFAFVPLPSIEWRGGDRQFVVGSVRRVLISTIGAADPTALRQFTQRLQGQELIDEKTRTPVAFLARQPESDSVARHYLQPASTWATVTPVVLPGYDDPRKLRRRLAPDRAEKLTAAEKADLLNKLDRRIDFLLRKALRQAGFSAELAQHARLEWRSTGFWPGTALASQYAAGNQHRRYRRVHVRLSWQSPTGEPLLVPGPICIGGGKFTGAGLFAAMPGSKNTR